LHINNPFILAFIVILQAFVDVLFLILILTLSLQQVTWNFKDLLKLGRKYLSVNYI